MVKRPPHGTGFALLFAAIIVVYALLGIALCALF
jgi:hypothetical protein